MYQNGRKSLFVFRRHNCLQRNLKESTEKLIELISEFGRVTRYEIGIEKSIVFLYTSSDLVEIKLKNKIPFKFSQITQRKILRCKTINCQNVNKTQILKTTEC